MLSAFLVQLGHSPMMPCGGTGLMPMSPQRFRRGINAGEHWAATNSRWRKPATLKRWEPFPWRISIYRAYFYICVTSCHRLSTISPRAAIACRAALFARCEGFGFVGCGQSIILKIRLPPCRTHPGPPLNCLVSRSVNILLLFVFKAQGYEESPILR